MKLLKRLPVFVGGAFALTVIASPAYAIVNQNGLSTNALSINALSMNALSMNALSMNALSMNGLSATAHLGERATLAHRARNAEQGFALRDALRELGSQRLVADSKH